MQHNCPLAQPLSFTHAALTVQKDGDRDEDSAAANDHMDTCARRILSISSPEDGLGSWGTSRARGLVSAPGRTIQMEDHGLPRCEGARTSALFCWGAGLHVVNSRLGDTW